MATYEDTNRSGRKICTMRHYSGVAMGNSPRGFNWRAEKKPTMANQVDPAPRRQCRLGYFPAESPNIRKQDKCARNSRTQRRSVRLSSDILAAAFSHSAGAETKGGGKSWATTLPSSCRRRCV